MIKNSVWNILQCVDHMLLQKVKLKKPRSLSLVYERSVLILYTYESQSVLEQEPANIFCERPDNKYFRLCKPYGLYCNDVTLPL